MNTINNYPLSSPIFWEFEGTTYEGTRIVTQSGVGFLAAADPVTRVVSLVLSESSEFIPVDSGEWLENAARYRAECESLDTELLFDSGFEGVEHWEWVLTGDLAEIRDWSAMIREYEDQAAWDAFQDSEYCDSEEVEDKS